MSLPTKKLEQSYIICRTVLPVSGLEIKYHSMTQQDAEVFIFLKENIEFLELLDHVRQLIQKCTITDIKVDDLPLVDIEFLFLQIHIASKGDMSALRYTCRNIVKRVITDENADDIGEEKEVKCGGKIQYDLNLNDIKPLYHEKKKNYQVKIPNTDMTIILKDVMFGDLVHLPNDNGVLTPENISNNIVLSIESIVEGEGDNAIVHNEFTLDEITEFVGKLEVTTTNLIQEEFLDRDVKLQHSITLECPKCKHKDKMELKGMLDFIM